MTHTKTIFDVTKEMIEAMPNEEILKIITAPETFDTNSSLMVYTSGVNRTNIEDRTMNTTEALNEVRQTIHELETKLQNEVRKVGSTLILAQLSAYSNAPRITAEIFTDEWDKQREQHERYIKEVCKGNFPQEVDITLRPMSAIGKDVELSTELMEAVEEFEDHVFENYALPIQKLYAKQHNLRKLREAERNL